MSATLKWGLITGMVYVIFSLISNLLGLQQGGGNLGLTFLFNTILLAATFFTIYLGVKEIRDEATGEYFTLGEAFSAGFKITLIAAVIAAVFTFIYLKFIDPDLMDKVMSSAEEKWDEMNVPEENREMGRKFQGYFSNPYILSAFVILSVIFWGLIKSLVAGMMLRKNPPIAPSA
ncbi:MAG TPA: DUF4199 domain-containing protein [Saprospiraceae bacterium]|nr:DUF4199 domain-containing protein [Saprospiraceae bacterium]